MNYSLPISASYRSAIWTAVKIQLVVTVICGFVTDQTLARLFGVALVAFWVAAAVLILRRPQSPSAFDLWFVRFGFLAVSVVSVVLTPLIWHLRGVL